MPDELGDENFALYACNDTFDDEFCLMALETITEGVETKGEQLSAETVDEGAEAVVTAVAGELLLGENSETLLEPLSDPWSKEDIKEEENKKAVEEEVRADEEGDHQCAL